MNNKSTILHPVKKKEYTKNYLLIYSNSEIGNGKIKKYFESITELQKNYLKASRHFKYIRALVYKGYDKENNIRIYDYIYFD